MSETTAFLTPKPEPTPNLLARLANNPVLRKELRGIMRGQRSFWLLTGYVTVLSAFIFLLYITFSVETGFAQADPQFRQTVGKSVFGGVVLIELILISFIAPALTAGAITSEREHQTFDLLRTTLLSARALVFGKLTTALTYLLLLMLSALPIQSLAFLLGGVGMAELLISGLLLFVTALFFAALGLFFSSLLRRTLASTVSTYAAIVISYIALGFALFVAISVSGIATNDQVAELIMTVSLWVMICTNPLLAAIVSEVILIEDQSLWYTTSMSGALNLPLPSPWIPFTLLYFAAAIVLILLSIHFVRRPSRI